MRIQFCHFFAIKYFYSFYGENEISSEKYKLLFSLLTFRNNSVKELIRIPALEKMAKRIESLARRERFRPFVLCSTIPFLLSHLNKVAGRTWYGAGNSVSAVKRIPNALSAAINRHYNRRSIIPYPRASRACTLVYLPHRALPLRRSSLRP